MTVIKIIDSSICNTELSYVMHQTNCVTTKAHGIAKTIYSKWPYGDTYASRKKKYSGNTSFHPREPGTVDMRSGNRGPVILNLFGQWAPGPPSNLKGRWQKVYADVYRRHGITTVYEDTSEKRLDYFKSGIQQLESELPRDSVVAVPYCIGCGMAGGNWGKYKHILDKSVLKFVLYRYNPRK